MGIELGWVLPCDGDTSHIGTIRPEIPPSYGHFKKIAQGAERYGFTTILAPTGQASRYYGPDSPMWDPIATVGGLIPVTRTIKFLLAIRAGVIHPAICARLLSTLDHISDGRLLINLITGGTSLAAYGYDKEMDHDRRYRRTDEYLQVLDGLWTQERFNFEGEFYQMKDARLSPKPVQRPRIPLWVSGSSEMAREIMVQRADYAVFFGTSPSQVAEHIRDMKQRLKGTGRTLKYATRFHIISRPTEAEAYEAAQEILSLADEEVQEYRKASVSEMDSQEEVDRLEKVKSTDRPKAFGRLEPSRAKETYGRTRGEMVEPYFWGGIGKVRGGSTVAITGSYEQCAEAIIELRKAGLDCLLMSGFPYYLETEHAGGHVAPIVREMEKELERKGEFSTI